MNGPSALVKFFNVANMPVLWDTAQLGGTKQSTGDTTWAHGYRLSDRSRNGVLVALCDSRLPIGDGASPCEVASSTLDTYYFNVTNHQGGDPDQVLTDALGQAVFMAHCDPEYWRNIVSKGPTAIMETSGDTMRRQDAIYSNRLTMIAAVVHGDTLSVAYTGENRLYLLHDGQLESLTSDSPESAGIRHFTRRLSNGDSVLLCTQGFYHSVYEAQIRHVLNTEHQPGHATRALLAAVSDTNQSGAVAVGVLTYRNILARTIFLSVLATLVVIATVFILASALTINQSSFSTWLSRLFSAASLPSPVTSTPIVPTATLVTPSQMPQVTPKPTSIPSATAIPATRTNTPTVQPTDTSTPTDTPEPTPTSTPTPTPTLTATPTVRYVIILPTRTSSPLPTATLVPKPLPTFPPTLTPKPPPPPPPKPTSPPSTATSQPKPTSPPPPPTPAPTVCPPGAVCH